MLLLVVHGEDSLCMWSAVFMLLLVKDDELPLYVECSLLLLLVVHGELHSLCRVSQFMLLLVVHDEDCTLYTESSLADELSPSSREG